MKSKLQTLINKKQSNIFVIVISIILINIFFNKHKMRANSSTNPINTGNSKKTSVEKGGIQAQKQSNMFDINPLKQRQSIKQISSNVIDAKQKLDDLIEDLNGKLVQHFKQKQEALLNKYKQQLVEQQKKLNQLKNTTNQDQIRAKMLQRKAQLQKQRNQLIETNMFFSQKCEQYKQVYTKLVQQSKDLEKQIQFLDGQIQTANAKRLNLVDQMASISNISNTDRNSELPLFSQKKNVLPQIQNTTDRKQNSTLQKSHLTHSVRKIARSLHIKNQEQKAKKTITSKNFQKVDKSIFNKSTLQKVFEQCVQEIRNRRKTKRTMPNLKGEQFTQYEKRAIMQIFLSNEEVKKKLYEIIFNQNQKNFKRGMPKQIQKTKISFDQFGI